MCPCGDERRSDPDDDSSKGGEAALTGPARALYEENRDVIDIETVEHSYAELKEIFDTVHDAYPSDPRLQQTSIDPYRNDVELVFVAADGKAIPSVEEVKKAHGKGDDAPVRVTGDTRK